MCENKVKDKEFNGRFRVKPSVDIACQWRIWITNYIIFILRRSRTLLSKKKSESVRNPFNYESK